MGSAWDAPLPLCQFHLHLFSRHYIDHKQLYWWAGPVAQLVEHASHEQGLFKDSNLTCGPLVHVISPLSAIIFPVTLKSCHVPPPPKKSQLY